MRSAPFLLELLHLIVGEPIRLKFAPRREAAHVSERQITGLADAALRAFLGVGAGRNAEYPACGFTIRLVARITSGVKAPISCRASTLRWRPTPARGFRSQLKSAPISAWPGAAQIMLWLQSPTTESGRG